MTLEDKGRVLQKMPKVLIFEHPPINKNGIGKTLYSFFFNWSKSDLAQVYSVSLPTDDDLCQYFYLSETGRNDENSKNARALRERRRRCNLFKFASSFAHSDFGTILRSLLFKRIIKRQKKLWIWIERFGPDCIFFGLGENVEENLFVLNLAKRRKIPLILYVSDDYMTKWRSRKHFKKYAEKLSSSYKKNAEYASLMIVISEKMETLYRTFFPDLKYLVASNSAFCKRSVRNVSIKKGKEIHFVYTGNLGLSRWQMLRKFAIAIEQVNRKNLTVTLYLDIYSQEAPPEAVIKSFTNRYSKYHEGVVGDELDQTRLSADVLLLVESFDFRYKSILETALSTKIPEYLSYGRFIFAWGPEYAWSVDYLKRNAAAYCVVSPDVAASLQLYIDKFDGKELDVFRQNANRLFDQKHEFCQNANRFSQAVVRVVDGFRR